jgi:hypothetical protein
VPALRACFDLSRPSFCSAIAISSFILDRGKVRVRLVMPYTSISFHNGMILTWMDGVTNARSALILKRLFGAARIPSTLLQEFSRHRLENSRLGWETAKPETQPAPKEHLDNHPCCG